MPLPAAAVIFDLDGTLIDSLEDLAYTTNVALAAKGFPVHPVDPYRYFVGDGIENLLRRAAPPDTPESVIKELVEHAKAEYSQHWARKTRAYDGIDAMLAELLARKIPLAVLSNKPHAFTLAVVAHFFPTIPFSVVQGSPPGGKAKPDPTLALSVAATIGVPPANVLFMGDTRTDMDTATAAGMMPLGVLWGFRPESELVEHGARVILRHPMELFAHV